MSTSTASVGAPSLPPSLDSGLVCLAMMARFHALAADLDQLAHEFASRDSASARSRSCWPHASWD